MATGFSQTENSHILKKVLFISSDSAQNKTAGDFIAGLSPVLKDKAALYFLFMDSGLIPDDENFSGFYKRAKDYVEGVKFDAITAAGDEALSFAKKYHNELFSGIPIISTGITNPELLKDSEIDEQTTGILTSIYFDENVLLAKRMFPELKRIHLVTDNSIKGKIGSQFFSGLGMRFKGIEFLEINSEFNEIEELTRRLKAMNKDDVIFYLSARRTLDYEVFDAKKIISKNTELSNVPVFNILYEGYSPNFLGGYYCSYPDMGSLTGKMLHEILNGTDPSKITANSDCPAHYYFNYKVMNKFNLSKKTLPPETIYYDKAETISDSHLYLIITAILTALALICSSICNIKGTIDKKKLSDELQENRRILHAVMDQSETVYWECDFSNEEEQKEISELEPVDDTLEELETVDDSTPLGRIEDIYLGDEEDFASVNSSSKNEFDFNKTNDVVMGWIYSGVIQREYREQFDHMLKDFKEGRTKKSIEIDIPIGIEDIRNNVQTERWKHIVYRAIKTENDKVIRAIGSATDVTSQKRAEREYEGIMKYQTNVQQSYPVYTRLNLTKNIVLERFINVPDMSKGITGNSAVSELVFLRNLVTTREQNKDFIKVLDREQLIIEFKNGTRTTQCDFCYKFSNGVLHWFNLCLELAFNPSSGDIEAYCYLNDITSQTISSITKDAVLNEDVEYIFWLNKLTGVCQFINKTEAVNWIPDEEFVDYDELMTTFLKKKVPDTDKEKIKEDFDVERIAKELETTEEVRFTYHTRKEDGSPEIKQEKVYFLEKNSNVLIFVCTDITAITLMENQQNEKLALAIKQAERANFAKSDFLSRMSHDLRTPMNGIIGIAELASKELDDPVALERDINKIRSSSSYMLGLLNDILDMSKIESGKMEIRKTKASFGDMIENIVTLAHVMCDKNGITFYCNRNPDKYRNYMVNVDRLHIQQVAMNLISNASKYTPAGGRIDFLMDAEPIENGKIRVTTVIRDTGAGMTKEFQKIMYDAFTQDSNSVNKVGTGLGLTIVHNLVRLMGGTIDCVSAPGEGTEFTIKLDIERLENADGETSSTASTEEIKERSVKGKRVLLVEDNELNQEIASRLLLNEGMEVEIAGNGLEALNMFSEKGLRHYDIILMDIMMPVMDGLQATHLLRGLEREDAKEVPIIAMTANAFTEDIEKCIEAGMNTHIAKPIEVEKMLETIKEYIG